MWKVSGVFERARLTDGQLNCHSVSQCQGVNCESALMNPAAAPSCCMPGASHRLAVAEAVRLGSTSSVIPDGG